MKKLQLLTIIIFLTVAFSVTAFCEELVVYSARKEHLIRPLFETYTKETGVKIKYSTDKAAVLLQRIKAEGQATPADLLITVDAGNLWHAAQEGMLLPVASKILTENIPTHLRDPQNRWFGLSIRARTIRRAVLDSCKALRSRVNCWLVSCNSKSADIRVAMVPICSATASRRARSSFKKGPSSAGGHSSR